MRTAIILGIVLATLGIEGNGAGGPPVKTALRVYENRLTPIAHPAPILADYPKFVQRIDDVRRFAAPVLIDDEGADLFVRAWRFSYNARGIIEIPNRLRATKTAVIVVHPWGIDDGQGWRTPEPAGVAFACTPEKNRVMHEHAAEVINPLLKSLRGCMGLVMYSLPGSEDAIRKKLYRSTSARPSAAERQQGQRLVAEKLQSFSYRGDSIPKELKLTSGRPAVDYFAQFPGLDAGPRYEGQGFWDLPIPVMTSIDVDPDDIVFYDNQGYSALRQFLNRHGIEHVLLCGYHADMCVCKTTAGYENLRRDFNVLLVGDAVQATLPANKDARFATNQTVSFASLNLLITQVSWIARHDPSRGEPGDRRPPPSSR
jgi:hypothetical protein